MSKLFLGTREVTPAIYRKDTIDIAEEKDINFYDYNGTCLHSYTLSEVQTLSKLPDPPVKEGYTITWNWTLEQIKAQGKPVDVGAIYTNNDGKLKITMVFPSLSFVEPSLSFTMRRKSGDIVATVDWGDGSIEEITATTNVTKTVSHLYTNVQVGKPYVITLEQTNCIISFDNAAFSEPYRRFITEIETGNIVNYGYVAFQSCICLKSLKICAGANLSSYSFSNASSLVSCNFPASVGTLDRVCQGSRVNGIVSLPYGIVKLGDYSFDAASIRRLNIPNTVTSIGQAAFRGCSLTYILIPSSVTSIGTNAFLNCSYLKVVDLSEYGDSSSIPTLVNTNAFNSTYAGSVFLVKNQEMLDAFAAASNWSTYASKFQIKGS